MGMKLIRTARSNHYCGPAALALITGKPVDEVVQSVKGYRIAEQQRLGRCVRVTGVSNSEMVGVLTGYRIRAVKIASVGEQTSKPTLARWLKEMKHLRACHPARPFLVNVTDHYIVVCGRKIYDNFYPEGIWLRKYPHRRVRVRRAWQCFNKLTQS